MGALLRPPKMAKTPEMPEPIVPAQRPERVIETEPEEVELGSDQTQDLDTLKVKGKRSLSKPSGNTGKTSSSSKNGLSTRA